MNKFTEAKVISNEKLKEDIFLISIETAFAQQPKPGQFYIIRTNERFDPLLGRPFSIFDAEENKLKFLYRIKGKGTSLISKLKENAQISITGPLGRGYPSPEGDFIVIAGGIGLASVYYLLRKFPQRAYLFYGVRNREEVLFYESLRDLSKELCVATECGSVGYQGLVTEVFKERGLRLNLPIYACGPMVMIKELDKIIEERENKCFVAVEERMACGIGACLGCVIETKNGMQRVCTEGPVFELRELKL